VVRFSKGVRRALGELIGCPELSKCLRSRALGVESRGTLGELLAGKSPVFSRAPQGKDTPGNLRKTRIDRGLSVERGISGGILKGTENPRVGGSIPPLGTNKNSRLGLATNRLLSFGFFPPQDFDFTPARSTLQAPPSDLKHPCLTLGFPPFAGAGCRTVGPPRRPVCSTLPARARGQGTKGNLLRGT
jgi:hypothetical protein